MGIRWPRAISITELWETTEQKPIILKIRLRKCQCLRRTPRKDDDSVGKQLLGWNPQGARRRGRQKQGSKKTGKNGNRKMWQNVERG